MKHIYLLSFIILLLATGCKKDWTCECVDNSIGRTFSFTIKDSRKPEAKLSCDAANTSSSVDCKLQ